MIFLRRLLLISLLLLIKNHAFGQKLDQKWVGIYDAQSENKDHLKTSFTLKLNSDGKASLTYSSDGEKAENYSELCPVLIKPDQLKIVFNAKYGGMGILYLEKIGAIYYFSGEPVYYINPGTERILAAKRD